MSFAATMALVALAEHGMPQWFTTTNNSLLGRFASWGGREIVTLLVASLFAGLATEPYAAFHFHRITSYGVLANLAAMPVVSVLVMPMGMLAIVAIPFGLDGFFWSLMEAGINWMIWVTQWVSALPGALFRVTAFGAGALALASLGMITLALLRSRLRLAGIAMMALALMMIMRTTQPDILIAPDGPDVAVRGADGALHVMKSRKNSFALQEWLAADADARKAGDPSLSEGAACDDDGCTLRKADGGYVALSLQPSSMADDCARADVVVTRATPPADCQAMVVSLDALREAGSIAMVQQDGWLDVTEARPLGVERPWSRRAAPQPVSPSSPRNAEPVDATPPSTEPDDEP